MSSEILKLFPTPIMFNSLGRAFTQTELDYINRLSKRPSGGNTCSSKDDILYATELVSIRESIQQALDNYKKEVLGPKDEFDIVITASWANWTNTNESHHIHKHPNSFLSGVIYVNTIEGDSITFTNPIDNHFHIETKVFSDLNAVTFDASVGVGEIVIFPSSLKHQVKVRKAIGSTRVSIAFNTYPKGFIGSAEQRTGVFL